MINAPTSDWAHPIEYALDEQEYISAHLNKGIIYAPENAKLPISEPVPCTTGNPDLFFSTRERDIFEAIEICNTCKNMAGCRRDAEDMGMTIGVWGGKNFNKKEGK